MNEGSERKSERCRDEFQTWMEVKQGSERYMIKKRKKTKANCSQTKVREVHDISLVLIIYRYRALNGYKENII